MTATQLDFFSQEEDEPTRLQRQVDELCESMGKVRRKLFAEVGSLKKVCQMLIKENQELRKAVGALNGEVVEWTYDYEGYLFKEVSVREESCLS